MRAFLFNLLFWTTVVARAATWNAATTSRTDVKAAIDSAADGDTVNIPAGTSTWTTPITVTNCITINGAGTNSTFLQNSQALVDGAQQPNFLLQLHDDKPLTVKNIWFKSTGGDCTAISSWMAGPKTATQIRITSCGFESFHFAIMVRGQFGVVDHCEFKNNTIMSRNSGWYDPSDLYSNITATRPWDWDSTNTWCIEDCHMSVSSSVGPQYCGDTELPAAYTVRYCTFDIARTGSNGYDGWDCHGNGNFPSGINNVGIQIYKNTFNWSGNSVSIKLSDIRGGYGSLVYSNTITGTTAYNQTHVNPAGSTAPQQVYFWENRDNTGNDVGASIGPSGGVALNVNFFTHAPDAFKQMVYPHPLVGSPAPPVNQPAITTALSGSGIRISGSGITLGK